MTKQTRQVHVGVVAKYLDNQDTYMSVFEALRAAGWAHNVGVTISWIDAEALAAKKDMRELEEVDGILVPGGFGERGVEGKIKAATFALETGKPYLGLCLGMQTAVIAAARRAGLADANSAEFSSTTKHAVIHVMEGQSGKENTGGTMRLGDYPCVLADNSLAAKVYGSKEATERHRHRYECNNDFRDEYESWGIRPVGFSPDHHLVEIIEAIDHPFFIASQFHPEFKSRPNRPHPLFGGFIDHLQNQHK
jgi:CTP synthase